MSGDPDWQLHVPKSSEDWGHPEYPHSLSPDNWWRHRAWSHEMSATRALPSEVEWLAMKGRLEDEIG